MSSTADQGHSTSVQLNLNSTHLPAPPPYSVEAQEDSEILINAFLPPSDAAISVPKVHLELPFCLPQLAHKYDSPFVRGYNAAVQIPQADLLAFIDGLNMAIVASPPLRVVDAAGLILGFVPYHWAQIAGTALTVAAEVTTRILSKTLTDRYLRTSNKRLFNPRGLVVRLYTIEALQHLLNGTIAENKSKTKRRVQNVGRGVGKVLLKLPLPVVGMIVHAVADKPPTIRATSDPNDQKHSVTRRRLAIFDGKVLPMDLNMPDPAPPKGVGQNIQTWGVRFDKWRSDRTIKNTELKRVELERLHSESKGAAHQAQGSAYGGGALDRLGGGNIRRSGLLSRALSGGGEGSAAIAPPGSLLGRGTGLVRGLSTEGGLGQRLNSGMIGMKDPKNLEREVANADLIESWDNGKLLWIVVMNADEEEEIANIDIADRADNEEVVDDRAWEQELQYERDERR